MRFRKATLDDVPGIFDVMVDTEFRKLWLGHLNDEKAKKSIEVNMGKKERIYVVADDNGRIAGYFIIDTIKSYLKDCPVEINQKYAYCKGIGVHSDYRGKGVAKELYKASLKFAKKKYKGMYADIDSDNIPSIKLHEKVGFNEIAKYKSEGRKKQSGINVVFGKKFSIFT